MRDRSAILPATIILNATPWNCGGGAGVGWGQIPAAWSASTTLDDADLVNPDGTPAIEEGSGKLAVRDTIHAIYSTAAANLTGAMTTPPTNSAAIAALAKQLAKDLLSWRLVNFDTVYNGVIAPDLDGYTDEIAWTYTAERCETKTRSAPLDSDPEAYNHSQGSGDCPNCVAVCVSIGGTIQPKWLCRDPYNPSSLYYGAGAPPGDCCCSGGGYGGDCVCDDPPAGSSCIWTYVFPPDYPVEVGAWGTWTTGLSYDATTCSWTGPRVKMPSGFVGTGCTYFQVTMGCASGQNVNVSGVGTIGGAITFWSTADLPANEDYCQSYLLNDNYYINSFSWYIDAFGNMVVVDPWSAPPFVFPGTGSLGCFGAPDGGADPPGFARAPRGPNPFAGAGS